MKESGGRSASEGKESEYRRSILSGEDKGLAAYSRLVQVVGALVVVNAGVSDTDDNAHAGTLEASSSRPGQARPTSGGWQTESTDRPSPSAVLCRCHTDHGPTSLDDGPGGPLGEPPPGGRHDDIAWIRDPFSPSFYVVPARLVFDPFG